MEEEEEEMMVGEKGEKRRDVSFNLNETRINDVKSANSIRRALLIQHD